MSLRRIASLATFLIALMAPALPARAADAAFTRFIESLWPQAQKLGVTRATFDSATRGLEPDYKLPDLVLPGQTKPPPTQAEFIQVPADYIRESSIARLAARRPAIDAEASRYALRHRAALRRSRLRRSCDLGP